MSTSFKHHFQLQGYNALLQLGCRMHVTDAFTFFVINHKQPLDKTAVFLKHIPLHLQGWRHFSMSHLWLGWPVCYFCSYVISQPTWTGRSTSPNNGIPPPSPAFIWLLKYPYFWTANRLRITIINKKKTPLGLHTYVFPPFKNWRPWSMGCEWWIIY